MTQIDPARRTDSRGRTVARGATHRCRGGCGVNVFDAFGSSCSPRDLRVRCGARDVARIEEQGYLGDH